MMESGHGVDFFVLLTNNDADRVVAGCRSFGPTHVLTHDSGRPWLIARLHHSRMTVLTAGERRLILLSSGTLTDDEVAALRGRLERRSTGAELIAGMAGSHHVILSTPTTTQVQGTLSGIRRVYHATVDGQTVVSDRADVLAQLTSADLDEKALVVRMLEPVNHPLGNRPMWRGIQQVPSGQRLETNSDGRVAHARWWHQPTPQHDLEAGATAVRHALASAVRAHTRGRQRVFTELSGGFDSTAVTALAVRDIHGDPRRLTALTVGNRSMGSDERWAALAVEHLRIADHHVVPAEAMPLVYAEMGDSVDELDEPSVAVANRATLRFLAERAAAASAEVHLTGHGGDHLFFGMPTLARDVLQQRPLAAIKRIAAYRAMFDWRLTRVVAQLADTRPYRSWLAGSLSHGGTADIREPLLAWGSPASVPPWLSPHGREVAAAAVADAARHCEPLAPSRGAHTVLDGIQQGAALVRALSDVSAGFGLPLTAPFFDDRVIEAALSVNVLDRVDPWAYKPVLREAMRGIVPDGVLARRTKDEGTYDVEMGRREYGADLRRLWEDSRLAECGLVDRDMLIRLSHEPDQAVLDDGAVTTTVACEMWLRSWERRARFGRTHELIR